MPANIHAVFTKEPNISSVLITAANTSSQGGGTIGTDIFIAFQANATEMSRPERLRLTATATAPTTTTATVARIFHSTVLSGATTSANTRLIGEVTLPATAADNATAQSPFYDFMLGFPIPPNTTILVTNHAAPAASTAWRATVFGGNY